MVGGGNWEIPKRGSWGEKTLKGGGHPKGVY